MPSDATTLARLWDATERHIDTCPDVHPTNADPIEIWLHRLRDHCEGAPFEDDLEAAANALARLEQALMSAGITVTSTHPAPDDPELAPALGGFRPRDRMLYVAPRSMPQMLSTMAHESAHVLLCQNALTAVLREETQEVLAEATACLFCARRGIHTIPSSSAYLAPYALPQPFNPRALNPMIIELTDTLERLLCPSV